MTWQDKFHCQWDRGSQWSLHIHFTRCDFYVLELKCIIIPTYNMTMQNGHDTNFHILHPTDSRIRHARRESICAMNWAAGSLCIRRLYTLQVLPVSQIIYYNRLIQSKLINFVDIFCNILCTFLGYKTSSSNYQKLPQF